MTIAQRPQPATIVFGTDGWRAKVADEFTFESVRRCAEGVARYVSNAMDISDRIELEEELVAARAARGHEEGREARARRPAEIAAAPVAVRVGARRAAVREDSRDAAVVEEPREALPA